MSRAALDVSIEGAHITRWAPDGFGDVLWCAPMRLPGKPLRGGIPICWPWFGPHPTDPKRPQHGYARLATWAAGDGLLDGVAGERKLEFALTAAHCRDFAPEFGLEAMLVVEQAHRELHLTLTTINTSTMPAPVSFALHTYFAVSDVAAITVEGLDGSDYRDNTCAGAWTRQTGPMRIAAETIALFDDARPLQSIIDPGLGRQIDIRRAGTGSTIVWNPGADATGMADIPPGEERRFVCVESGCIGERAILLKPEQEHVFRACISVSTL